MAGSASYSHAGEPIPGKSLAHNVVDLLGIEAILECHDGIVSEGDKGVHLLATWPLRDGEEAESR